MSPRLERLVSVAAALFFGLFFVLPIWGTLRAAFVDPAGGHTLAFVGEVFRHPLYREGLVNSFLIAVLSTLGCLMLALPLAVAYVRYTFPGRTLCNSLLLTPLILPPFVGALGVQAMLGQAGALNSLLTGLGLISAERPIDWLGEGRLAGVVLMNVLHLYPIVYLNVAASLANLDPALEEAAANLGCPPWRRFWRITLPLTLPGLFAGAAIAFIWAFTELGVPLIFDYARVTSVQIFSAIKDLNDNPFPYALVVVLLFFTTLFYALGRLALRGDWSGGGGRATTARTPVALAGARGWLCAAGFLGVIALALLPHAGVVLMSLAGDWYRTVLPQPLTLAHYRGALGHELTLTAIANSLKYASLATLLDAVLGVAVAWAVVRGTTRWRHWLDTLAMLPLAVPGIVMAFGYLALSREGQPLHGLMLGEDPVLLLVIAYAMRRLPYVVRSAAAGLQQVSPALEEAAQNLGAAPLRALWRITLPLVAPNLLAGGLLAFAFAMLEVSDSMILAQQTVTFPITKAIYTLASALGDGPAQAAALGVWSMLFLTLTLIAAGLALGRRLGALFRA
ncbi:iron ABC transporter permease [Methyloparacoccus murrellii]